MIANSSIDLVNLDFDSYKASLKAFLSSQNIFKDYDFEGSNMNVLLDLLSVNTFKNAFFLNMNLSEGFLDSAQLLNSVRSHAKDLNYLPRSATSAKSTVNVTFNSAGTQQPYIIPKGSTFSTVVKNQSFVFSMPETITVSSANTSFSFNTDIYEGPYIKDAYIFNATELNPFPKYALTNGNVDTSSLTVTVYEDGSVIGDTYKLATSLLGVKSTSKVYFIQCSAITGNYEIFFGDGVLGYQPGNGSQVIFDYRVSNGVPPNGASIFNINFDPTNGTDGFSNLVVTTTADAIGGSLTEALETTRFYAPRYFQVQERGVVATDYEILLLTQFPEIEAINVYGGEELSPPQFGKVVIALSIRNVVGLPVTKIAQYTSFIKSKSTLTITPQFILPSFTYINLDTIVRYNINVTNESANRINTIVTQAITDFNTTNLNNFNVTLRFSQLSTAIDESDSAIISNVTDISLYKKLLPDTTVSLNYTLLFNTALEVKTGGRASTYDVSAKTAVTSDIFTFGGDQCQLDDNGAGLVRIMKRVGTTLSFVEKIGIVDYATGTIQLIGFQPDSIIGDHLKIFVIPADEDVSCSQNTIMTIEPTGINLTIEQLQQ